MTTAPEELPEVERLARAEIGACFRPVDAEAAGISYRQLKKLKARGVVQRVERGLYWQRRTDIAANPSVAAVCALTRAATPRRQCRGSPRKKCASEIRESASIT